jgi:hypothetical protein
MGNHCRLLGGAIVKSGDMELAWDDLVVKATQYAGTLTDRQCRRVGSLPRADVDLDAGTIRFTGVTSAVAPVQVIGTVDEQVASWRWGWDHPSVPAELGAHAARVRDYGRRHGLADLITPLVPASAEDAWEYASVAALLSQAQGVTSLSLGRTSVFLTYGRVTVEALIR